VTERKRRFVPLEGPDGTLDPGCLEGMGERWVLNWLRERLSGSDPYLPLDLRSGEDPDARVVGLLRSAGPLHPASRSIGRASAHLLAESEQHPSEPPAYFSSLLRLSQQVRLPDAEAWFGAFVGDLAQNPGRVEALWGADSVQQMVYASIRQVRGEPGSAIHSAWLRLLTSPRYSTMALLALSPSFEVEVKHLATWWNACPASERPRELRQRIGRAVKLLGDSQVRELLLGTWTTFPASLRSAVNVALGKLRVPAIPSEADASRVRAIRNAGQQSALVLQAETERYQAAHGS
jgi:hypothetical protein